jgi:putative SOS response-associated peptidase YedK
LQLPDAPGDQVYKTAKSIDPSLHVTWKDPTNDEWLRTCTIITGEPNESVREIYTRMPVILPEHHDAWLSGEVGKRNWSRSRRTE